jgi:hypothetical protein
VADGLHTGAGSTPVPDPTVLTTAALAQAIAALREILEARMEGQKEVFETRLNGMDRAIALVQDSADRLPLHMETKVRNLERLHEEKFASVQTQFRERDTRAEQTQKDSKVAVDAALQAAKEAVGEQNKSSSLAISKSEAATTKQIDQLVVLITSSNKALDEKINDVKERVTRTEGKGAGLSAGWGYIVGAAGVAAAISAVVTMFVK